MMRTLRILARIVASIVGFLVGVYATIFAIAWGIQLIPSLRLEPDDDAAFFLGLFILIRGSLPRPRYDQLMALGWKVMLPLALLNLAVTGGVVLAVR